MTKYMHTINGEPAFFSVARDGFSQICYAHSKAKLEPDLKTIRRQQRVTLKNREKAGFPTDPKLYGHVRVEI
jgi:hypothetical protein